MNLFILIQALFTLFVSGGLFFKERLLKNRAIGLYFAIFSIEIFYFLYGTSEIPNLYPELRGRFYFSFGLIYGPLLWLHFKSIIQPKFKLSLKDLLHLIPLIVLNIHMFDLIIMGSNERFEYFSSQENFFNRIIYLNYARAIHQMAYAFMLYKLFAKYRKEVSVNEKFYLGGISVIYLITTIFITLLVLFANSWHDFAWYYIICNLLVLLITFVLYNDPKFFREIKAKYKNSSIARKDMLKIKVKIEELFLNKKVYLENELSIDDLSKHLNTKSHHISQTFTNEFNENFNDYVNKFRVEHSKKLLADDSFSHYKIEAIALDSGFNNKVTFYKAFSKFADTTPSQFRKKYSKA